MPKKVNQKQAARWLREKWVGEPNCPVCRVAALEIEEGVVELRQWSRHLAGVQIYPNFIVICNNCGHTMLFNAMIAGLVESPSETDRSESTTEATQKA